MEDWMDNVVSIPADEDILTREERLRRFLGLVSPQQPTLEEIITRSGGIYGGVLAATEHDLALQKKILDMERRAREHQKMRADCICGLKTNQHGQVGAEFLCHDPSRVHPYVTAAWDSARRRVHK